MQSSVAVGDPSAELGISVFEVPTAHVKCRKRSRVLACNSVAHLSLSRSVDNDKFVFVYQRFKKDGSRGTDKPRAIER